MNCTGSVDFCLHSNLAFEQRAVSFLSDLKMLISKIQIVIYNPISVHFLLKLKDGVEEYSLFHLCKQSLN